jgi:HK97 family phage major capsid protein
MNVQELQEAVTARQSAIDEAMKIVAAHKDAGTTPEGDEVTKLRTLDEQFKELDAKIIAAEAENAGGDLISSFAGRAEDLKARLEGSREGNRPDLYRGGGDELDEWIKTAITPGERFVTSRGYSEWINRFPSGGPSFQATQFSEAEDVGAFRSMLGLQDPTSKLRGMLTPAKFRSLVQSDSGSDPRTSAGMLVQSLRRGLLENGLTRPLTVRDLVTTLPVTTDTIEYVKEKSRLQNAAPVEEATALTGSTGRKPEGGIDFQVVTDTVKTIAEWVPITKRILSDAPQLRSYIDSYLTYDLALELEDQIVAGSGGGEDFTGILNTAGVLTQSGAATSIDDLRAAKRKVRVGGRTNPNAILMTPADIETEVDTAKDSTLNYIGQSPFAYNGNERLWGMPIIETEALDDGTAIVGDFSRAILFDRESTNISVGTADDDFIRNIVRVLAELRAGFGVIRPKAFCVVTF